jgi:AmmeMemoRadiSam system protein A
MIQEHGTDTRIADPPIPERSTAVRIARHIHGQRRLSREEATMKRSIFWWKTALVTTALAVLAGCRAGGGGAATPLPSTGEEMLSPEEQAELLQLARDTITTYLQERRIPSYETDNPHFLQAGGAFVTLKKYGELRGCIGYIVSDKPLYQTIQEVAVAAAVQDPRFPPVRSDEMEELTVEISLLSPMQLVTDTNNIVVGKHGLLIRRGYYQGLLLPQVAPEQGWNREQFLEGVCYKAGLPPTAWRDPATELYSFTAEVFGENEIPGH